MPTVRAILVDPAASGRFVLGEVAAPSPGPGEALVRVAAFSLNFGEVRRAYTAAEPYRPGWDLAGIVTRAADDGSGPRPGRAVVGMLESGAWCEEVAVPTRNLAELPDPSWMAAAATLPIAGMTALHAVERGAGLLGRRVLVTGASGGVGLFACRLAQLAGARVAGLIRQEAYRPIVEAAGAEQVFAGPDASPAAAFAPYRLIVDTVSGPLLGQVMAMLAPDGTCVALAHAAGSEITFDLWPFAWAGRASLYGFVIFNEFQREPPCASLERLVHLLCAGQLRPHIAVEAGWDEIAAVAGQAWQRRLPGKAVLRLAP